MNHIYKVIWNKAKHCYTVVSEIAKSHSDSTKRVRMGTTAALMAVAVLTGFAMPAQAAVTIEKDGTVKAEAADINALNNLLKNGVTTTKDGSVTVGGLTVKKNGEVSVNSPDVVYGKNAKIIWDSNNTMGQISIGNNATAITGRGGQESSFAYDGDYNHAAGAIAIGANTYARTGSIMIGSHVYKGNMGDVKNIDTDSFNTGSDGAYGFTVNSTTIGTNSFTRGNLATTIGDYNIQSGRSVGYGFLNALNYGAQNFGATVIGALNSNESQSDIVSGWGTSTSGVANSIVGVANKVNSSNGTLVFGAGNEVTHSLSDIYGVGDTTSLKDAKKAQDALKNAVAESNAGGAVLAIGGANKADWARKSQLIGVGNTLTGASSAVSEYNMINGYKNEVTNATHTSIIGSNNTATNIKSTIVMGDNNALEGLENVISLGNNNTVKANNAVAIGNRTTVKAESGVAIGVGSVANRVAGSEKGVLGYFAPETIPTAEKSTWTSTKGAVSVGDTVNNITRQITDVAAGSEDTDAVNVAQLKQVASQAEKANQGWNLSTNGEATAATNVAPGGSVDFSGDDNVSVSNKETKVTVALNKDVKLHSATFGDTVINDKGLTIGGGTSGLEFSKNRVSVGGQQIHDVADGKDDADAVNMSQLNKQAAASKTTVSDGTNTKVTSEVAKDGHTDYKVNLNKDLTGIESMTNGSSSIRMGNGGTVTINNRVTIDQSGKISGVAAGSEATDAVNVAQLKQVAGQAEKANQGWNLSTNGVATAATNVAPGGYVDFSGDDNVSVSNKETKVTVALNKDVKLHSATFEDTVINAEGLTIGGGTSGLEFSKNRVSVGGQQIHDVADGKDDADAVNMSQLNKQAAASKTTVSDGTNTKVTSEVAKDGHTDYKVNLNKDLTGIESISNGTKGKSKIVLNEGYAGMAYGDTNVVLMNNGVYLNGKVNVDKAGQIHNVTAGTADEDAVNVSQLNKQAAASKTTVSDGINTTVTSTVAEDGHTDYKVNLNKDLTGIESMTNGLSSIRMGNGGTVTINKRVTIDQSGKISGVAAGEVKEGSTDAVNGSQLKGVENKADKNAENIQKNTDAIDKNTKAIDKNTADISKNAEAISKNTENIQKNSKAIAENAKNIQKNTEAIAKNTEDISKNTEAIGKLDERVTSVEEVAKKHTTVSTDDKNVQISEDTNKDGGKDYKVSLNKDLNLSSVTTGDTKMDTNGVTVKDVSLTKDGLSIGNKTYVSDKGLNANDQKVTNVAAGDLSEKSTDAVNGSQLFATNQQVAQNAQSISKLGNRINKVGAGAAALAALHPLDFDPDDKWDFAAGYGNYNGENAAAIGAYYRPNEDTMFSVGGSFGNGENMVNAGVSLKLGQGNHVSTSKVAMAKEIKDLRKEMEGLKSALLDANAGKKLDTSKLQLFPDVPKNHWAYEYVSTLKGNGMLTGYPDGEFKGDRPMTRYEFATMLYKAMLEGATLSDKILKEFAPELERFTVDTVHQDKDGKPTVERVRTVKAAK